MRLRLLDRTNRTIRERWRTRSRGPTPVPPVARERAPDHQQLPLDSLGAVARETSGASREDAGMLRIDPEAPMLRMALRQPCIAFPCSRSCRLFRRRDSARPANAISNIARSPHRNSSTAHESRATPTSIGNLKSADRLSKQYGWYGLLIANDGALALRDLPPQSVNYYVSPSTLAAEFSENFRRGSGSFSHVPSISLASTGNIVCGTSRFTTLGSLATLEFAP